MFDSPINKRDLILASLSSLIIVLIIFLFTHFDHRTKIVFCNVGQGDGAYIRVNNNIDILIDAGPDRKILNCLGKNMPFYDRKIELALLSHPEKDHYGGYQYIIDRYKIDRFITAKFSETTNTYRQLIAKIKKKNATVLYTHQGYKITASDARISFLWPKKNLLLTSNNDNGLIFLYQENDKKVLFTADVSTTVLEDLITNKQIKEKNLLRSIDILKVAHHGSKNSLSPAFYKFTKPRVAIISVGKNSYSHPTKEVLNNLVDLGIKIKRTDVEGDIIFKITNNK